MVSPQYRDVFGYAGGYGILFLAAASQTSFPLHVLALTLVLGAALVALSVIDHRSFRLPDALTIPLACLGLAAAWWFEMGDVLLRCLAAATGFLVIYAIDQIYFRIRGRHGLGLGDAKLFAASGTWVGLSGLPTVLIWACVTGIALALLMSLRNQSLDKWTRIPFGPSSRVRNLARLAARPQHLGSDG